MFPATIFLLIAASLARALPTNSDNNTIILPRDVFSAAANPLGHPDVPGDWKLTTITCTGTDLMRANGYANGKHTDQQDFEDALSDCMWQMFNKPAFNTDPHLPTNVDHVCRSRVAMNVGGKPQPDRDLTITFVGGSVVRGGSDTITYTWALNYVWMFMGGEFDKNGATRPDGCRRHAKDQYDGGFTTGTIKVDDSKSILRGLTVRVDVYKTS